MNNSNKSVIITGASSGIGRDCARHMDRLGWRVFAGVRKESDAASLRAERAERAERVESSGRLTPLILDVTDSRSVKEAARFVAQEVGESGLNGLVNNAGIPYGGPVEYLNVEEVRAAFEVNFFGVLRVTQTFIPLLRAGRGRIVNISSISGLIAMPFVSPYTTSKFALEAFSDSLRVELSAWDIHVSVIEPGAIDTPIWNKAGKVLENLLKDAPREGLDLYSEAVASIQSRLMPHGIAVENVSKAIAHALTSQRPRSRYAVGAEARIVSILKHLPDRWRDALIGSQLPKRGKGK